MSIANDALVTDDTLEIPAAPRFHVVSVAKLILMSTLTFGAYTTYWYYRQWLLFRGEQGFKFIPLLLSLAAHLTMYPLLKGVERRTREAGKKVNWSPLGLTLMWGIGWGLWAAGPALVEYIAKSDPSLAGLPWVAVGTLLDAGFYAVPLVAMMFIQQAINHCEGDDMGRSNSQITVENINWIVIMWFVSYMIVMFSLRMSWWAGEFS